MSQLPPTPPPLGLLVTDEGAGYQLQGQLGRGGMGVVFRAFEQSTGRAVALKLSQGPADASHLARFRREGEIAASLTHPGIVRVYSTGSVNARPYLCFELVEGARTLADALRALPLVERLRVVVQVAEALGYAHARGVVHRDVKPENVLLDPSGRARLTDFGVSSARGQDRLTGTGMLVGTPAYASPEQLTDGHRVGPPADVWSLGVILYEALTGRLPFSSATLLVLVAEIAGGHFEPPSAVSAEATPRLEAVCLKALARDPDQRYRDGEAFAADLERALRGAVVEAPLRQSSSTKRVLFALSAPLLLALLGGGAWLAQRAGWGGGSSSAAPSASPSPTLSPSRKSWRLEAAGALAAGDSLAARGALERAPAGSAAPLLWARLWLLDGDGERALAALREAPEGEGRGLLAYRAALAVGSVSQADELARGARGGDVLEAGFWAHLAAAQESPDALGRRLRQARRAGGGKASDCDRALELARALTALDWPIEALWIMGEESDSDPRFPRAVELASQADTLAQPGRRAFGLWLQAWLLPRARFAALRRLSAPLWQDLVRMTCALAASPLSDALRILFLAREVSGEARRLVLPTQPLPEDLVFSPERVARLDRISRFLLAFLASAQQTPRETPWPERRRRLDAARALCPPVTPEGRSVRESDAWPNETRAMLAAYMIEAHRCWEECWDRPPERAAGLRRVRGLIEDARELLRNPSYVAADWRSRVLEVRVALLEGDLEAARRSLLYAWGEGGFSEWHAAVELEVLTCLGERARALKARATLGQPFGGWGGPLANTLAFLEERAPITASPTPEHSDSYYPFPWRAEGPTRILIEQGWRPGQPLIEALDRGAASTRDQGR